MLTVFVLLMDYYDISGEKIQEKSRIDRKMKIREIYKKMISRNGLPYTLLQDIINKIERTTNDKLASVTNFTIKIHQIFSKFMSTIEIFKLSGSSSDEFIKIQNCSGFERYIVGLVLRLAIMSSSNLPMCNFIALDEGFACMDSHNLNNLQNLIHIIRNSFDFSIIVSHLDILKENCDNYINIYKSHPSSPSYVFI